jgi:hypothetical protein
MASGSDSDYSDAEEIELEESENFVARDIRVNGQGQTVRGKDVDWVEVKRFATANEYVDSDIGKKIVEEFTSRKSREFDYADVKIYHCRYSRRVGFKPCPWMFKVSFLTRCSDVIVETNDGLMDHLHDEDPEYELNPGAVFKWTEEMNKIIEEGVVNHAKPNVIKRNLNEANLFLSRKPSKIQLYNKIAAVRKRVFPSINIVNTHQMRQRISNVLEIPASEVEGYVPYWEIDDENDEKEPRFCVIFTSKKNQEKLSSIDLLQTDATYRLNWMGFPVFVIGEFVCTV